MKIALRLVLELMMTCLVIASCTWLLQKFAWWIALNHYGMEFTYISAILCGSLFVWWFHHFYLNDGRLLFKDKEKNDKEE